LTGRARLLSWIIHGGVCRPPRASARGEKTEVVRKIPENPENQEAPVRRALLVHVLLVLAASVAAADEVYIPSNSPGTGSMNAFPFNNQYGTEWRYQLVIPAAALGHQPMKILDIAFAPSGTGDFKATTLEVRMSHSTVAPSTTFAANLPNPQVVLSTTAFVWKTTDQTWSSIGLAAPFLYNGVDYLTIEVRFKGSVKSNGFSGNCYQVQGPLWRVYNRSAGAYTATTGSMDASGLKTRITIAGPSITLSGSGRPGTTVTLDLASPSDAGRVYQLASSLGTGPVPIGTRLLNLSPDSLLLITVFNQLPAVFVGYSGTFDTTGAARAWIHLPNLPFLTGVRIHSAFVSLDVNAPQGIHTISPTATFSIQ